MKRLSILGSTGSIGCNVLNIVEMFPQEFAVDVLAAKGNVALLARQIERFRPSLAVVYNEQRALELRDIIDPAADVEIVFGDTGPALASENCSQDGSAGSVFDYSHAVPALSLRS